MLFRRGLVGIFLCALFCSSAAHAQLKQPLPIAAFDIRAFYSGLGQDETTATSLGIPASTLPKRSLGGVAGLQLYPIRTKSFAFGIGGEGMLARGRAQKKDENGVAVGSPVQQRLRSLSAGFSLNFGHRNGWSYVSAAMGPLSFSTFVAEAMPDVPPPRLMTINLGGGARWFFSAHSAFTFDVRIYQTRPELPLAPYGSRKRSRLLVLSAGISLK